MNAKILIIDDEKLIRFTFRSFLSEEGHEVVTAKDYASAIEVISTTDLDLIFADIVLDGHSGIEILQQVKEKGMQCPVVMITGQPDVQTASASVRLGAFDYLPKPVRRDELLRISNTALKHKALEDEKARLELENERYRGDLDAIFRSVDDGIVTVDEKGRVIRTNVAAEEICGLVHKGALGRELVDVLPKCYKPCLRALKETLRTRRPVRDFRVECKHQHKPGQIVALNSSPLLNGANGFAGAVIVMRDVTRLNELEAELTEKRQFHRIIGKSKKLLQIFGLVESLAHSDTTVLITGESGTGKELVAEAVHYAGDHAAKPLVKVNCSALPENLLESELFGHVKGAFTGAVKDRQGRFQAANHGTIFLDEIGDISQRIQLKLLRVLQEKEFERVGDSAPVKVDVRIVASTNRNLKEKVRLGEFREDLYYRIKVVEIALPPLRERVEDIPLLVDHFCDEFNQRFKKNITGISEDVRTRLMLYPWPGNVRELEHAIEHAYILCPGDTVTVDHIPAEIRDHSEIGSTLREKWPVKEPENILQALEKTGWNKAKAARLLGLSRRTIYRKMDKYNIENSEALC